jgi:hypothetical protein
MSISCSCINQMIVRVDQKHRYGTLWSMLATTQINSSLHCIILNPKEVLVDDWLCWIEGNLVYSIPGLKLGRALTRA